MGMCLVKANDFVHNQPNQIDHPKSRVNLRCFVLYVKCFQTFFEVAKEGRIFGYLQRQKLFKNISI